MILPSGIYFIGDPCYVVNKDGWDMYLDSENGPFNSSGDRCGILELKGHKCFWANTAYGDGRYDGFAVDSGMLGLTPIEVTSEKYGHDHLLTLGKIEFLTNPTVDENNGIITLGPYVINTDDNFSDFEGEEE